MTLANDVDHEGDLKLSWRYVKGDREHTIMAQQMEIDDKGTRSFRQWNPERLDVKWGEDNGSYTEDDAKSEGMSGYYCCLISGCIEKLFKMGFQETINVM